MRLREILVATVLALAVLVPAASARTGAIATATPSPAPVLFWNSVAVTNVRASAPSTPTDPIVAGKYQTEGLIYMS